MTHAPLIGLMAAVGSAVAPASETVDKRTCAAAYEAAQELRQRNLQEESRERLRICSDPRCPRIVREECEALMVDIDQLAPDDAVSSSPPSPPAQAPPPEPMAKADPAATARPVPPVATAIGVGAGAPIPAQRPPGPSRAALLPGGLAVVALASAAFFGWRGLSQADELRRTCSPDCEPSQVSPIRRQLLIADLSLLAGVGLGTVTAWMIWSGRSAETRAASVAARHPGGKPGTGAGGWAGEWSLVPGLASFGVEYGGRF